MAKRSNRDSMQSARKKRSILCSFFCCAFVFLAFVPALFAEVVSYESALIWRVDGKGDYLLPEAFRAEAPQGSVTPLVSQGIASRGLINSITAVWRAEGPVSLEVSADDGLHYTAVTNGVPLKEGLIPGSILRWRAKTTPESRLSEVKIVYSDSSGLAGDFGDPRLSGFKFKKSIRISGSKSGPLFNYQVKIRLGESAASSDMDVSCEGHLAKDFKDVLFTLPDTETVLPYFLERVTGNSPGRIAEFIVKIPQIPAEGILLYVFYGNAAAESMSDPQQTFDFYEDFSKPSLDPEKWSVRVSPSGSALVSQTGLLLDAAGISSKSFQFKGGLIEYAATAQTGSEVRLVIRDPDPDSGTAITQVAYASPYGGAQHCIAVGNIVKANDAKPLAAAVRYNFRVMVDANNITFERFDAQFKEKQASVSYKDAQGPRAGAIGLKTAGMGRGERLTRFHWIRVRKYSPSEPEVLKGSSGNEEAAALPVFVHTLVASNGDLVLAEGANVGIYMTKETPAAYKIRIVVPGWKGRGVSVDISANAGASYRKDCANNTYYYASRGDFASGGALKGSVTFGKDENAPNPALEFLSVQYAFGNIVLVNPNGGEQWPLGSQRVINWSAWDYQRSYPMKLEYSLDGGDTFTTIVNATENDGVYLWNIPARKDLVTSEAKIRISDAYDGSINDVSDNTFSIKKL